MITIDPIRRMDDQMIIKYARKFTVPLPDAYCDANDLQPKDDMIIFRERVNGCDALILIPKKLIKNNGFAEGPDNNAETESPEGAIKKVL